MKPGRRFCLAIVMVAAIYPQIYAGTPVSDIDIILEKIPGGVIFDVTGGADADQLCVKFPKRVSPSGVRGESWTFEEREKGMVCAHGAAKTNPFVVAFDIGEMKETEKLDFRISAGGVVLYQKKGVTPRLLPAIEPITDLSEALAFPEEIEPGQFIQAKVLNPELTPPRGTWKFSNGLSGTVIEERPEQEEAPVEAASDRPTTPPAPTEDSDPDALLIWVPNEFGGLSGTVVADEEAGESTEEDDPASLFAVINGTRSNLKKTKAEIAGPTGDEAVRQLPRGSGGSGKGDAPVNEGLHDISKPVIRNLRRAEAAGADLAEEDIRVSYTDPYGRLVVDAVTTVSVAPSSASADLTPAIVAGTDLAFAGRKGCVCGHFPGPRFWNALTFDGRPLGSPLSASSRVVAFTLAGDISPGPHTVAGSPEAGYSPSDHWQFDILQLEGNLDQNQLRTGGSTSMSLRIFGTTGSTAIRLRNLTPQVISLQGGEDQVVSTSGGEVNLLERTVQAVGPGGFDIQWELTEDWCPCAGPQRFAISEETMPVESIPAGTESKN